MMIKYTSNLLKQAVIDVWNDLETKFYQIKACKAIRIWPRSYSARPSFVFEFS